jgi:hypothetical protein
VAGLVVTGGSAVVGGIDGTSPAIPSQWDHLTEANQVGFVTSTRTCPLVLIDDPGVVQAATITAEPVAAPVDKPPPASTLTMVGSVELHVQVALTGLPR